MVANITAYKSKVGDLDSSLARQKSESVKAEDVGGGGGSQVNLHL